MKFLVNTSPCLKKYPFLFVEISAGLKLDTKTDLDAYKVFSAQDWALNRSLMVLAHTNHALCYYPSVTASE